MAGSVAHHGTSADGESPRGGDSPDVSESGDFIPEQELNFNLSPVDASLIVRALSQPQAMASPDGTRSPKKKRSSGLYIFLSAYKPGTSERITIERTKRGGLQATYAPKRWMTDLTGDSTKQELRNPIQMDMQECQAFVLRQARPIVSVFIKDKLSISYPGFVKVRLDRMTPVSPADPKVVSEPFWDLEIEAQAPHLDLDRTLRNICAIHGLAPELRPSSASKSDRARQFGAASPMSWARRLEEYATVALALARPLT